MKLSIWLLDRPTTVPLRMVTDGPVWIGEAKPVASRPKRGRDDFILLNVIRCCCGLGKFRPFASLRFLYDELWKEKKGLLNAVTLKTIGMLMPLFSIFYWFSPTCYIFSIFAVDDRFIRRDGTIGFPTQDEYRAAKVGAEQSKS